MNHSFKVGDAFYHEKTPENKFLIIKEDNKYYYSTIIEGPYKDVHGINEFNTSKNSGNMILWVDYKKKKDFKEEITKILAE